MQRENCRCSARRFFPRRPAISALREAGFLLQRTLSGSGAAWAQSLGRNFREAGQVRQIRRLYGATTPFLFLEHHLCHAASAYYNTSFNLFGEPLVSDPREAIRSLYCAGIDALAIGDFLVVK